MANAITARTIIQEAAKSLGAYFRGVLTAATVNPHTTLTVGKLLDLAFDGERFQYWYVTRVSPSALSITSITSASGTVLTTSAHFLAPGDTVTIAGTGDTDYDGVTFTVLTTPTDTTFTITSGLGNVGAVGTVSVVNQYRIVTTTGLPSAATATITRAFQGGAAFTALPAGTLLDFYLLLNPDEWFDCLNTAITSAFYKDSISQALTAGDTEYNLSTNNAWFQTKGQVIRARFRNTATALAPQEEEVSAIYFDEVDYAVTCRLPSLPSDVSNTTLEVDVRHYYPAFTTWSSTTTLPQALAVQKLVDVALKKVFQKLGPAAKKIFGMAMVVAERDLAEAEGRWLDNTAMRDYSDEDWPQGGDPSRGMGWGW